MINSNRENIIKNIAIVILPLVFFLAMIIITHSVSKKMYDKASIELINRQTDLFYEVIKRSNNDYANIPHLIKFPIVHMEIYANKNSVLFSFGKKKFYTTSNPSKLDFEDSPVSGEFINITNDAHLYYEMSFKIQNKYPVYCKIIYDFTAIKSFLFKNGRTVLLLIFIFTLTIIYFLFIVIFAYQKRINANKKTIQSITNIDSTTGFYLSQYFFELLDKEIDRFFRTRDEFTLLICEIENFHGINRLYSDDFGNQILKTISKIIRESFRNFDIIGKTGENEISIVMVNSNSDDGNRAATRCKEYIEENKFYFDGVEIIFSLKVGIVSSNIYKNHSKKNNSVSENRNTSTKEYTREIVLRGLEALNEAKKSTVKPIQIYNKTKT